MSEQTSPLHDPATTGVAAPGRVLPRLRFDATALEWSGALTVVVLVAILVLGAFLRLTHVNWDANSGPWDNTGAEAPSGHLHPDERFLTQIGTDTRAPSSIANYFDTDHSALNPYNISHPDGSRQSTFVYGTLPLFMNKVVASYAALPNHVVHTLSFGKLKVGPLPERAWDDYDHFVLTGRVLSAIFDIGTILLIFLLGRQLANRGVGLLAAFLYAVSAFPIQNAHFFIMDPFVTFFATLTILFAVRAAKQGGWHNFAIAGATVGLGAACKVTAISLLPVVLLAIGVHVWPAIKPYVAPWWDARDRPDLRAARDGRRLDRAIATLIVGSLIALAAAFVAFRIAMPYAFSTPSLGNLFTLRGATFWKLTVPYPDLLNHHWLKDQADQRQLLSSAASWPPNVQWIGRSKWFWPAQQMVSWGMGPALGITAWLGVIFAAVYAYRRREGVWLVPLAWIAGYFGFMGAQFSLYMRYFLPLYPTLAVLAAVLLYQAWRWASSEGALTAFGRVGERLRPLRPAFGLALRIGVGAVVVMTLLWGLAFYNIYRTPVTRVVASKWIYEHVPAGAMISHESWDDSLPYAIAGVPQVQYGTVEFNNFDPDTPQHVQQLLSNLDQVDYIALSSRRVSGTITRAPAFWPVTSRYYAALESGDLGFQKVAEFTSYPRILGMTFNDTSAEESWSVYDHPQVVIYRKTDTYSHDRAVQVLHADAFVAIPPVKPGDEAQNGLLFRPDVLATQQAGGTWSDIFHPGNVVNAHPLFFWLLAMELAAFALVPLAVVGFRGLPDRGFLLTKPLGIFALAYLAYAPASYGAAHFTRTEIAGGLGALIAVGLVTGALWRHEVAGWVRDRWRFILLAEAVFLLAFLFSYWLRLQNPDLFHPVNGGEKPMDFAYFNGVIRTTDLTQGPIDPWYAGGYLNYYWYGQFIAATVTKLTGIVPEVAYNLAIPMFFSLAAAATFSLTYNLADATRRLMKRRPGGLPISPTGPVVAALAAIFLVLVAGNLKAVQVLEHSLAVQSHWHSLFGWHPPLITGTVEMLGGFKEILFGDGSLHRLWVNTPARYDWWAPSRALSVINPQKEVQPITEFPFWTFLFADLHAHLMAMPFALTAVAVALGVVLNYTRLNPPGAHNEHTRAREISGWAMVVVLAAIVGGLRWINSWDYPPFLLIGAAALIIAERAKHGRFTLHTLSIGVVKTLVMGALSYAFFARFAHNYSQAYNGVGQSDQTTALADYLSHFGILLFLVTGFVLFNLNRSITRTSFVRTIFFGGARRRKPIETAPVMAAIVLAGAGLIWAGTMHRWGVTALAAVGLVAVVLAAYREVRSPTATAPIMLFVYAMIALGLGLSGGVELLTLDGDVGRMNTVFKFYLHVWLLWGVVGAYSLWYLLAVMRPQEAFLRRAGSLNASVVKVPRYAFAGIAAVLLALALVYPYFGTRARIHDRFNPAQGTGNDGLAFLDKGGPYVAHYDATGIDGTHNMQYTRDGINWLREHVQGTPTTFEAIGPSYRSLGSRVSIYTGLPTVSGWGWHQEQQRVKFAATVQQRQSDVNEFYSTPDVARARELIRKYDVQWVIVGDEEQFNYPASGLKKFNDGLGGALELAYQNPGMQIWHVIPQAELATVR